MYYYVHVYCVIINNTVRSKSVYISVTCSSFIYVVAVHYILLRLIPGKVPPQSIYYAPAYFAFKHVNASNTYPGNVTSSVITGIVYQQGHVAVT